MAEVFAGTGDYIARSKDIDLDPVLDEVAAEIESYAIGLAAEHVRTGDYASSLQRGIDRTSPSRRDRIVFSDDPAVLAIEYGFHARRKDGSLGAFVPGQHILARAAQAARGPQ